LTVRGIKRRQGTAIGSEAEAGYLDQCKETGKACIMM
jgi:hypothetical protein